MIEQIQGSFIGHPSWYNVYIRLREAKTKPHKRKEVTTMKKQIEYKFDHIDQTITLTKKFALYENRGRFPVSYQT